MFVYVLAPNYRAYEDWCVANRRSPRQSGRSEQVYAWHPKKVRGGPQGACVVRLEGWQATGHARAVWYALLALAAVDTSGTHLSELPHPWPQDLPGESQNMETALPSLQQVMLSSPGVVERRPSPIVDQARTGRFTVEPFPQPWCNCPVCTDARTRSAGAVAELPTRPDGFEYVYLLDGPHGDTVGVVRRGVFELRISGTVYTVFGLDACTVAGYVGYTNHRNSELCRIQILLGFCSGANRGGLPLRSERALHVLNTLVPYWVTQMGREVYNGFRMTASGYTAATSGRVFSQPVRARSELNWTDYEQSQDYGQVCAHVCGGEHECEARATTEYTFKLPTGGERVMPVCQTCYNAEIEADQAVGP